jgi:hypothetical protein
MRIWIGVTILGFLLMASATAAEVEGFLVDKACSARIVKAGQKAAASHNKDCALMDGCADSGFGVLTADNRFLTFDKEGSKKAAAALEASKKSDNLKIKVTGDVSGETMKVASIKIL